jgi:hypothetical protein
LTQPNSLSAQPNITRSYDRHWLPFDTLSQNRLRRQTAASSPSSFAQVCSFSSFRSGALPSRGHRRRGDPACSPPSRARYGVRLPRRVVQRMTTDAKATPNGSRRTPYDLLARRRRRLGDPSTSTLWRRRLKNIACIRKMASEEFGVTKGGKREIKETWWWNEKVQKAIKEKK